MGKVRCAFCESDNLEFISEGRRILKRYRKVQDGLAKEGNIVYPTSEYLCLDCGCMMHIMEKENLEDYNENKEFFIR